MKNHKSNQQPSFFVGIDGGGTKTLFALANEKGEILNSLTLGASNPFTMGFETTKKVLSEGLSQLCNGISPSEISLFAGIAGIGSSNKTEQLTAFLSDFGFAKCQVGSDIENIFSTGLQDDDGIAVIMGTGCSVFAKKDGNLKRFGGFGYLFDKGGNAYTMARDAISAVLADEGGYGEKTILTDLFHAENHCKTSEMLPKLYEGGNAYIASFSRLVDIAYEQNDKVAQTIVENNMAEIAKLLDASLNEFPQSTVKVVFSGGLTKQANTYFFLIKKHLQNPEKADFIALTNQPVLGALRLAGSPIDTLKDNNILQKDTQK